MPAAISNIQWTMNPLLTFSSVKQAKEKHTRKSADEYIRALRAETITLRDELEALEEQYPDYEDYLLPEDVVEATSKVEEADQKLEEAEKKEERRRSEATVALGRAAAELDARKKAFAASGGGGVLEGSNFASSSGTVVAVPAGPLTGSTNARKATQAGFAPSPPAPAFKTLPAPAPRQTRSTRAGDKRKEMVVDEGEDAMFPTMGRGGTKRSRRS